MERNHGRGGAIDWAATRDEDATLEDVLPAREKDSYRVLPDPETEGVETAVEEARRLVDLVKDDYANPSYTVGDAEMVYFLKGHRGSTNRASMLLLGTATEGSPRTKKVAGFLGERLLQHVRGLESDRAPEDVAEKFREEVYELVHRREVQLTALSPSIHAPGFEKVANFLEAGRETRETEEVDTLGPYRHIARTGLEALMEEIEAEGQNPDHRVSRLYQSGATGMYPVGEAGDRQNVPYLDKTLSVPIEKVNEILS